MKSETIHSKSAGWIAVFDHSPTFNSPAGSCVLTEVMGLCDEFDITVFSDAFDNGRLDKVQWVRVPLPKKPGFLRYMVFQLLAPLCFWAHILKRGKRPLLIQATQGQFIGCDIAYPHFCHRAYLKKFWRGSEVRGLRRLSRWISYRYNAYTEALAFSKAKLIVTPSQGLAREIVVTYPDTKYKVITLPNPIDYARFSRPPVYDRTVIRHAHGLSEQDVVLVFIALGDFARKGLKIIFEAMQVLPDETLKLWIVGGNSSEIRDYTELAKKWGLGERVRFVGFQKDVRPYLWSSDIFVFPSVYEIFPLVTLQAAATSMPIVCTHLYGVEEYIRDGENGWLVQRDSASVGAALQAAISDRGKLRRMGEAAAETSKLYDKSNFVERWRSVMQNMLSGTDAQRTINADRS